jgi:hypothetical protein
MVWIMGACGGCGVEPQNTQNTRKFWRDLESHLIEKYEDENVAELAQVIQSGRGQPQSKTQAREGRFMVLTP